MSLSTDAQSNLNKAGLGWWAGKHSLVSGESWIPIREGLYKHLFGTLPSQNQDVYMHDDDTYHILISWRRCTR